MAVTGRDHQGPRSRPSVRPRVGQLVLTVLEGSYLFLASDESLKRGRLPRMLQEVSIRDRGFALTSDGDLVILISAESAVEKRASRGFVHRHALVVKKAEYDSIGGTPVGLLAYVPSYEKFRQEHLSDQRLESIEIPDSHREELLTRDSFVALQSLLPRASLPSILSTLIEGSGRIVVHNRHATFDQLQKVALTIVALIPPRLRSNITFGVDLGLKNSERMDLELYRGSGTSSVPTVEKPHRVVEDLASAAFRKDTEDANEALKRVHRDFAVDLKVFEELTSREEAVTLALDSYQRPEFRKWASEKLLDARPSRAQRLTS